MREIEALAWDLGMELMPGSRYARYPGSSTIYFNLEEPATRAALTRMAKRKTRKTRRLLTRPTEER